MSQLIDEFQGRTTMESRARSPSMNNEEVISAAHYPSATLPGEEGEEEWDTSSLDSKGEEEEKEEEEDEEMNDTEAEKKRRCS